MRSFVFEANIAHLKEADPERRARIQRLLAEEEAKLKELITLRGSRR
jgi:hypothetical protein